MAPLPSCLITVYWCVLEAPLLLAVVFLITGKVKMSELLLGKCNWMPLNVNVSDQHVQQGFWLCWQAVVWEHVSQIHKGINTAWIFQVNVKRILWKVKATIVKWTVWMCVGFFLSHCFVVYKNQYIYSSLFVCSAASPPPFLSQVLWKVLFWRDLPLHPVRKRETGR